MASSSQMQLTTNSELENKAENPIVSNLAGDTATKLFSATAPAVRRAPEKVAAHVDTIPGSSDVASEIRTLFRHSSHYLGGLLGKMALGFVSMPIFTRAFSVADYGLIDFAQKILLLLVACSKMGLQQSALRFFDRKAFARDHDSQSRYYSTMLMGAALMSGIVAAVLLALSKTPLKASIDATLLALTGFVAVLVVLRALESMLWAFMRSEEKTKAYNLTTLVMKIATIAAVCFLLWRGRRTAGSFFAGTVAVEVVTVAILTMLLFRRQILSLKNFDATLFRSGLLFGAPLVLYEIASIVLDSGDRVLVRHYLGADALGLYSVAYGLSAQVNEMLILPLNLAIFPIYMRLWKSEGREATITFLSTCLDMFLMVAAGVCAIAAIAAHDGLVLLASSRYAGVDRLIPIIVIGLLLYTTHVFLAAGLLIHKNTGTMAILLLISAVVNIAMNVVLLPRIGLMAGAIATLLSYMVCIGLLAWFSNRVLPLEIQMTSVLKYVLAAAAVWAVVSKIKIGMLLVSLTVKSTIALLGYCGLIYILEPRVRDLVSRLFHNQNPLAQRVNTSVQ
jgi:O-antigen/teichoic acid export membrane protein